MPDDIDYQALYEQVQRELEATKIAMLKMRNSRGMHIDMDRVRAFAQKNYILIVIGLMVLSFLVSTVRDIYSTRRKTSGFQE